jgi:iron complex outermembrane receptor protein
MTQAADGIAMNPHGDSASSRFGDLLLSRSLLNRHNLAVANCAGLRLSVCIATLVAGLMVLVPAIALGGQNTLADLADASLEDLMKIEVTSVSKRKQDLFHAPSAIFVLTSEDIRRSGASNIPELLRLVPGVSVAGINGHQWAISARGFNGPRANKLLVMIDGRSVYSPMFSGVDWDALDLVLEDVERIEVIRGPGSTLWGANAVNGIINILTKHARDTQGGVISAGIGSFERANGMFRYGSRLGSAGHYRAYTKYADRNHAAPREGAGNDDDWNLMQTGFRADIAVGRDDSLMLTANVFKGDISRQTTLLTGVRSRQLSSSPTETQEHSAVVRWARTRSVRSDMSLQASFSDRRRKSSTLDESVKQFDIDFQHHVARRGHDVVWGLGNRSTFDSVRNTFMLAFTPDHHRGNLVNVFVQDDITIRPDSLSLTVGSKLEHHDIVGLSFQPSARISWTPARRHAIWGAVSRAVRTPSRGELNMRINAAAFDGANGLPVLVSLLGNPDFTSEHVTAYEVGHRVELPMNVQVDTSAFYGDYRDLRRFTDTTFVEREPAPVHLVLGRRFENGDRTSSAGLEAIARWHPRPLWGLDAGFSWLGTGLAAAARTGAENAMSSPAHQWHLASRAALPRQVELDATLFGVGAIPLLNVPRYTRLDVRLGRRLMPNLMVSLAGQNLLDSAHLEFVAEESGPPVEIRRRAHISLAWNF